jgi:putative phosphoesterase
MIIGLVSDTHMSSGVLSRAITNAFQEIDLIFHAGDLVTLSVLRQLEAIAPVTAVQGNMDMPGVRLNLPTKTVVEIEGHLIGLIHGHHVPNPHRVLPPPIDFEALHHYLLSEFQAEKVDCIIYGHTHHARIESFQDVLFINPGSATRDNAGQRTVGLLTVGRDQIRGEIIQLSQFHKRRRPAPCSQN